MSRTPKLLVEYAENPLAVGTRVPRFFWEISLSGRGRTQSAYQLLVATSKGQLQPGKANLWDSGRVTASTILKPKLDIRGVRSLSLRTIASDPEIAVNWAEAFVAGYEGDTVRADTD